MAGFADANFFYVLLGENCIYFWDLEDLCCSGIEGFFIMCRQVENCGKFRVTENNSNYYSEIIIVPYMQYSIEVISKFKNVVLSPAIDIGFIEFWEKLLNHLRYVCHVDRELTQTDWCT